MTLEEFFNKLESGATWSTGVSFKRANPLPIERYSVFSSLDEAQAYVSNNPVAYPGQLIAVFSDNGSTLYYIDSVNDVLTLKEVSNPQSVIEDAQTKLDATWSSQKISDELNNKLSKAENGTQGQLAISNGQGGVDWKDEMKVTVTENPDGTVNLDIS